MCHPQYFLSDLFQVPALRIHAATFRRIGQKLLQHVARHHESRNHVYSGDAAASTNSAGLVLSMYARPAQLQQAGLHSSQVDQLHKQIAPQQSAVGYMA